jgi:hypothetical protein
MTILLTIGLIPKDWDTEIGVVAVGSPDHYGTKEVCFRIEDDSDFLIIDDEASDIKIDKGLYEADSDLWNKVIDNLEKKIDGIKESSISSKLLARAYNLFTEEDDDKSGMKVVASDGDGGEFENEDGRYNGKLYMRYCEEEDDEYFNEKVVVFK